MVKRIAACVREYRRDSLLTPLCVALEVLLEVLIPLVMADLIDRGIEAGDMGHVLHTGALLAVMALFSLTFGVLSGRFAARASAGLATTSTTTCRTSPSPTSTSSPPPASSPG